jgi:transposase
VIGIPGVRTYYLYRKPTDMRKSFSGLGGLVINEMRKDLLSGDGFIFINKRRTLMKILVWDRTGYVIYYKKLASGTLELPNWGEKLESRLLELPTLLMMLEGVEIASARLRKRYIKPEEKRA